MLLGACQAECLLDELFRQLREPGLRREVEYAHLTEIVRQRDPDRDDRVTGCRVEAAHEGRGFQPGS